jgi:hypothetical protein
MIDRRTLNGGASRLVFVAALAGLALAGCKPSAQQADSSASSAPPPLAALPLSTTDAAPIAPAPTANALPAAPRARTGRLSDPSQRYAFADRAYAMNSGFGDAPPDYTFDYGGGERPWVWRGDDQSTRVAEPLPGGAYRYYYYEPGADTPYLVRDPDYSYGYDNGVLVVIYDRQGRIMPQDYLDRRADVAGRFLARALAIFEASQRDQREAVAEANWAARRDAIAADREQWAQRQAADQDWRTYHDQHQQEYDAQWAGERYRREAEAARFAQAVNDPQLAQHDWQAARQAQTRAATPTQAPPPPPPHDAGSAAKGPPPPAPSPSPMPMPSRVDSAGTHAPDYTHQPSSAPQGPGTRGLAARAVMGHDTPPTASPGPSGAFQADAARRASAEAASERQTQARTQALAHDQAARQTQLRAGAGQPTPKHPAVSAAEPRPTPDARGGKSLGEHAQRGVSGPPRTTGAPAAQHEDAKAPPAPGPKRPPHPHHGGSDGGAASGDHPASEHP